MTAIPVVLHGTSRCSLDREKIGLSLNLETGRNPRHPHPITGLGRQVLQTNTHATMKLSTSSLVAKGGPEEGDFPIVLIGLLRLWGMEKVGVGAVLAKGGL